MGNFTPYASLIGGALIGFSASLMLLLHGRIAGITGILAGVVTPEAEPDERKWRLFFLAGLVAGAAALFPFLPERFELGIDRGPVSLIVAGVLVGWGTRLGSGCTSGHGVCGISRGSPRSLVATLTFIVAGMLSVFLFRIVTGAM